MGIPTFPMTGNALLWVNWVAAVSTAGFIWLFMRDENIKGTIAKNKIILTKIEVTVDGLKNSQADQSKMLYEILLRGVQVDKKP